MLIQNGLVLLFEQRGFVPADLRMDGAKIAAVAPHLDPLPDEEVIDAAGCYITPGLIDAHSHICISEEGMGDVGDDCCDYSGALTPELEVLDGIYPFDRAVASSVRAGVTCACVCPGSDAVVGGVSSVIRLTGSVADDMLVRRYAAMKCSLGENPKNAKYGFSSRMGVANQFRKCLEDAIDYRRQKAEAETDGSFFRPDRGMEHMLMVLEKKMPVHFHAHRSDDICTAVRLAREFDLDMVIVHGTDAIPVVDHLARNPYPVIVGPGITPRSKHETWDKTFETAAVLHKAGISVCLTADHDVSPLYYLPVYAGLAARFGLGDVEALRAITATPADVLGIAGCKGRLQAGLDADVVIWSAHPFAWDAKVEQVFLEGRPMC